MAFQFYEKIKIYIINLSFHQPSCHLQSSSPHSDRHKEHPINKFNI